MTSCLIALLPQLDPGELDSTIPGWHIEKLTSLLYELPKALRREIGDVPEVARAELLAKVKELGTRKRGLVTDDEFREIADG